MILLQVVSISVPLQVVLSVFAALPTALLSWWIVTTNRKNATEVRRREKEREQRKEYRKHVEEIKDDFKSLGTRPRCSRGLTRTLRAHVWQTNSSTLGSESSRYMDPPHLMQVMFQFLQQGQFSAVTSPQFLG